MEYIHVALATVFSIITLFILTKLMGRRQVTQLSMFDYINGITIGSIAAEMATALEDDFWLPFLALVIYGLMAAIISYIGCKSFKFRRFIVGKPLILLDNGKIYEKNLIHAKLDMGEFMSECRINGFFNIQDIRTAFYEPSGKLSFIPTSDKRPANPSDFGMAPKQEKEMISVIVDGKIITDNLKQAGKDENYIKKELKKCGATINEIFFGYIDDNNKLVIFEKTKIKLDKKIFE